VNRALRVFAVWLLLGCGALVSLAHAELEVPKNDGWVTDQAKLLSPAQEQALEALMESYRRGTTHEIAVLTIPTLGGESLERYALEVGRAWGMGTQERNNAALLLVVKQERKLRIEVARGLEGMLTDSISGRIIRDVISPAFKRGDYAGGIRAGVEAMHAVIGGDYKALPRGNAPQPEWVGALVALLFITVFIISLIQRQRGGRGGRGGRMGSGFPLGLPGAWGLGGLGGLGGRGGRGGGGFGGGGFGGFGGGGGFSGGGSSGGW
jgi:uncharacterized protein